MEEEDEIIYTPESQEILDMYLLNVQVKTENSYFIKKIEHLEK